MSERKWVQHISGQGEKWELHPDYTQANSYEKGVCYIVVNNVQFAPELRLPRSEYRLCQPPERWEDVTENVTTIFPSFQNTGIWNVALSVPIDRLDSFRLRKTQIEREYPKEKQWAFIVEKRVQP